ncbi:glycosyltransferase family 9 protein [Desulfovibrio sp. JC022]|uniref:glycosyltransferase family 9 protein n=1 Tax=Desulfovibrio sp. JC022 TaxID=2593642 RepID=UPI001EF17045|nr:glycosyltransferase family 9 protein [Desulfovibrio sp. JC022]
MTNTHSNHKVVFRLSALGDVVLTTGVIEYWARKHNCTFTVITKNSSSPVLENNPHITNVINLEKKDLGDLAWIKKAGQIATEYEDCELIDLHSTLRSRILGARWKGKVSRYNKFSLERRMFKLTRSPKLDRTLSELRVTQRYASALEENIPAASELLPRIYLTEDEKSIARTLIEEHDLGQDFIALHPYATHPDKAWPAENWHTLIKRLNESGIKWTIIGRDDNVFEPHGPGCNFTSQLQLRETCALLKKSALLITGDSGPMHLAASVETPVIAMFGPTSKAWGFYPAGPHDVVLESEMDCRPCSLHGKSNCKKDRECLRKITPEEVFEKILGLMR